MANDISINNRVSGTGVTLAILSAAQEFLANESKYALRTEFLELCKKYDVTPEELTDSVAENSIGHQEIKSGPACGSMVDVIPKDCPDRNTNVSFEDDLDIEKLWEMEEEWVDIQLRKTGSL